MAKFGGTESVGNNFASLLRRRIPVSEYRERSNLRPGFEPSFSGVEGLLELLILDRVVSRADEAPSVMLRPRRRVPGVTNTR